VISKQSHYRKPERFQAKDEESPRPPPPRPADSGGQQTSGGRTSDTPGPRLKNISYGCYSVRSRGGSATDRYSSESGCKSDKDNIPSLNSVRPLEKKRLSCNCSGKVHVGGPGRAEGRRTSETIRCARRRRTWIPLGPSFSSSCAARGLSGPSRAELGRAGPCHIRGLPQLKLASSIRHIYCNISPYGEARRGGRIARRRPQRVSGVGPLIRTYCWLVR